MDTLPAKTSQLAPQASFCLTEKEPSWLRTCRQLLELAVWYGAHPICFQQNGADKGDIPWSSMSEDKYGTLRIKIDGKNYKVVESKEDDALTLLASKEEPVSHLIAVEL